MIINPHFISLGPKPFKFTMNFNATTFQTDPTGCLTYADDCAGYTPVSSPPSSLGTCGVIGDWLMKADGTSDNPLLDKCFYATFKNNGNGLELYEKLNPQNLTQKIATWNTTTKEWETASGSSSITSYDTMFCIPTIYESSTATSISLSDDENNGTAYAHTIGGHTYMYLAIGVYPTYVTSSVAYSKSDATSTVNITRPDFRTYSTGKTVANGHAMIWNFHHWQLLRIMTIFAMKSFNGQSQIGQGGYTNGARFSGHTNAMGPFAGSTYATADINTGMKAFVEDWWGHNEEFIDDIVVNNTASTAHAVWAGQNAVPDDTYDATNKVCLEDIGVTAGWNYAQSINTAMPKWGMISTDGGSTTTGLCDGNYFYSSRQCPVLVGGYSQYVSSGAAGPSFLRASTTLSFTNGYYGARLAFVFDI